MSRLARNAPLPTHDVTRCPACGTLLDRGSVAPPCDNRCTIRDGTPRLAEVWHGGRMLCRECALVAQREAERRQLVGGRGGD